MISDFGLARTVDDATLTRTGVVAGTPHYMSPEQATGQSVDQRSDLFSLGSVIYFMCTGRPPFRAEHALAILSRIRHDAHRPVDEVNREIPAELAEIVDQLLAKEPHQRFRDATAVEQTLESLLARMQNGKRAPHIRWRRSWRRWQKFVKQTVWISSISAACLLTGAGMTWWQLAGVRTSVSRTDRAGESATQPEALPSPEAENNAMTLPELPPDDFARGLNEVQNSMLRIEAEWAGKPRWLKLDSQFEISNWSRELQRLRDAMERMKQGLSVSIDQLQPTISEPVQRKDQ